MNLPGTRQGISGAEMETDQTHQLQAQVRHAYENRTPLKIIGGDTKAFYGFPTSGSPVVLAGHTGVLDYSPTELVIRARAGTPLVEINQTLQAQGQMLACEPPVFGESATFGGMAAAGLSGPARPYRAAVQDTVLGCTILNGRGELLSFGGKVMKNVAGYDVSRLMVGSLGCLGLILDLTVKVIPAPTCEATIAFTVKADAACQFINTLRRRGFPVTGTCQTEENSLLVRFSAGKREIEALPDQLANIPGTGTWKIHEDEPFWELLREQRLAFFQQDAGETIWRLSLPTNADLSAFTRDRHLILREWGGAQVWLKSTMPPGEIFSFAEKAGGHATVFRASADTQYPTRFQPMTDTLMDWQKQLKRAFDPAGIFNSGRMYREF